MKKILLFILSLFLFIPGVKGIEIKSLGLNIDIPKEYNPVTRETNYDDKYDYLTLFYRNEIYLQTYDENEYIIYIRAIENPGIQNYKKGISLTSEVLSFKKLHQYDDYKYIESGDFQWIRFNYKDETANKELLEYYLCWNQLFITITIQPKGETIDQSKYADFDKIVKTVTLTGDGQAEVNPLNEDDIDTNKHEFNRNVIWVIVFCVLLIVFTFYMTRRKKK